jgi:ornithine lipid ester-linked acyl 2-hydroxylase
MRLGGRVLSLSAKLGFSTPMSALTLATVRRLPRIVANRLTVCLFVILFPLERVLFRHSRVGHTEFIDPAKFSWVPALEDNWLAIRRELDEVLRYTNHIPDYQDLSDDAKGITTENAWKSFFFYAYGVRIASNCARCPQTAALLDRIEGMKSGFFSILRPGTHLRPHRGHYAGVLRYHLGLIVPDVERCRIRVGGTVAHWQEGSSLIFDDTFEHEVWNDSSEMRVVLFVDFARPLPYPLALLNNAMIWLVGHSSVVQPGVARLKQWNERLAAVWRKDDGAPDRISGAER